MKQIAVLKNSIQNYSWGSRTFMAELLGRKSPANQPEAELWMGAHPKAPSEVLADGKSRPLDRVIAESPREVLGAEVVARFDAQLPFLFKVLAASQPLSIQAHPDRDQARAGFEEEERAGVPIDAPERNYVDRNHKPEIICALEPIWALSGFRPIDEILGNFDRYAPPRLARYRTELQGDRSPAGLARFY